MPKNKAFSKIAIFLIIFLILAAAVAGFFLIKLTSTPAIVSKESVTITPSASNTPALSTQISSQITGVAIKEGSVNQDLLKKMMDAFNLSNTWYDFGSGQNIYAKTVNFSFLPIESATNLQLSQKAETISGPDGKPIRIISSTYDSAKQELNFQIYYQKSFLDPMTANAVSSEWTSAVFRTLSLSANPDNFKKDSKSTITLFNNTVGQLKLLEIVK